MPASAHAEPGDKITPVALYFAQSAISGDFVTREVIRVGTWLRTPGLPEFAGIHDATLVRAAGGGVETLKLAEAYFPVGQVIAMHIAPPAVEKIEVDPTELNRVLVPVSLVAGHLRIDGALRMPGHLTLAKQMGVMREPFTMVHEATVTTTLQPGAATTVPMVLVRPNAFVISSRI